MSIDDFLTTLSELVSEKKLAFFKWDNKFIQQEGRRWVCPVCAVCNAINGTNLELDNFTAGLKLGFERHDTIARAADNEDHPYRKVLEKACGLLWEGGNDGR